MRKCIGGSFSPHGKLIAHAKLKQISEPALGLQPSLDAAEVLLVRLFLRRYVTYCARRRRYAQMNGAPPTCLGNFAEVRPPTIERSPRN